MGKYICKECGKEFNDGRQLGGHFVAKHTDAANKMLETKRANKVNFIKKCLKCGSDFVVVRCIKKMEVL